MCERCERNQKAWDEAGKRKGYVYVIGFFFEDYFNREEMNNIFYVGMCLDPRNRLPSHPKRLKGAKSKFIEFHSVEEAAYAEKVLIDHFNPEFNKSMFSGFANNDYAGVLKLRKWTDFTTYKSKDKKTGDLKMEIVKPRCFETMMAKSLLEEVLGSL